MSIELRPYQEKSIGDIRHEFAHGHRAVCGVMPCGAGKTVATQSGSTGPDILAEYAPEAIVEEYQDDDDPGYDLYECDIEYFKDT